MKVNETLDFSEIQKDIESHLQIITHNAFKHNISNAFRYTSVFILYILGICSILFSLIANRVFPFQVLSKISNSKNVITAIGSKPDAQAFVFGVYTLLIFIGVLIITIAVILQNSIVRKNQIFKANALLTSTNAWFNKYNVLNPKVEDTLPKGTTLQSVVPKDLPF